MIKFYSYNLVDQATITASSQNALFPTKNLKHPFRTKVFRSNSNQTNIVFDFGETSQVDSIVLVDNKKLGFGFNTARIELNGSINFDSPAFSHPITINQKHHFASAEFPAESYRFANLVIESTEGFCEVSSLFIGKALQDEEINIDLGWEYQEVELSTIKENRYKQKFVDLIGTQKQISFALRTLNKDEMDKIFEIYDSKSTIKPFYARVGNKDIINDPDRFSGMFYLASKPRIINKAFGLYDLSVSLEEAM